MDRKKTIKVIIGESEKTLTINRVKKKHLKTAKKIYTQLLSGISDVAGKTEEEISKLIGSSFSQMINETIGLTEKILSIAVDNLSEDEENELLGVDINRIAQLWYEVNTDFFISCWKSQKEGQETIIKVVTQFQKGT